MVPPLSCRRAGARAAALTLVVMGLGCAPETDESGSADPAALTGEFVTYVADFNDGHAETWHAVRTTDGREVRLDFDTPPGVATGTQVRIHGDRVGERMHVNGLDVLRGQTVGAAAAEPPTYAAPMTDTYALVLVDLGKGVNMTTATGQTTLFAGGATDKSFANYYKEVSYGKYQVTGDVIGPFPFSMTTCDTTGMYKAIEPMITGTYNHLIYYFNQTSLCDFGGLGEEGAVNRPAKRTWMNGSLSCVVLMQEPGHNLGLMHANTMKCGSSSFSTDPASACTITEYGSSMSTMGGGCRQFNAYERWYMQWLSGCNGVRVPANGTFNLVPLESDCSDGSGVQVLQVPFPATLTVSDPQATTTAVNLKDYYVELRTSGGLFDAYSTSTRGSTVTFSAPTVFVYTSDDVHVPSSTSRNIQNSVWTELLNMSPSGTSFTGLTAAGQSFADPAGGPTITLKSISATGATVDVSYPNGGSGSPTCIDGSTLAAPGPTSCGGVASGTGGGTGSGGAGATGGSTGSGGATATGGSSGRGGTGGSASGSGGRSGSGGTGAGTGGMTGLPGTGGGSGGVGAGAGGTPGSASGTGGSATGGTTTAGGTGVDGAPGETLMGGCSCTTEPGGTGRGGGAVWLSVALGLTLIRARRRRA
jgi:MYXO-CTERM domain-containing protein